MTLEQMLAAAEEGLIQLPSYNGKWNITAADVLDAAQQMVRQGLVRPNEVPDSLIAAGRWISAELKKGHRMWRKVKIRGMYHYRIEKHTRSYSKAEKPTRHLPIYDEQIINEPPPKTIANKAKRNVVVISDLHIPYTLWDLLYDTLEELQGDFDTLVIAGDLLDVGSVSSFGLEQDIPLFEEYNTALEFIDTIRKMFGEIFLIRGNHEKRTKKAVIKDLRIARMGFMLNVDVLSNLANGIVFNQDGEVTGVKDFKNVHYAKYGIKMGDVAIMHPSNYSKIPLRVAASALDKTLETYPDVNVMIVGHTHQAGIATYRNRLIVETGCWCTEMPYAEPDKLRLTTQQIAYATFIQKNGQTDFRDVNLKVLGSSAQFSAVRKFELTQV